MYAVSSVVQQREAQAQPEEHSLRLGLLVRLAQSRLWLLGMLADVGGFVLQFVALGHGPLVLVQPLLVSGLLFALPLSAAWSGRRLGRADWGAAALTCAGLALFLVVANPATGSADTGTIVWGALLGAGVAATAVLVALSRAADARLRAVLLSGAAGILYGVAAALTKTSAHFLFSGGLLHLLAQWQPYALAVLGLGAMVLSLSGFQASTLGASLPILTVSDPVVSIVIGALAFSETVSSGPGAIVLQLVGLVAMSIGVFLLSREPPGQAVSASPPEG